MSKNDIGLLRSLIREMVNEAPYRSSQRVTLSGVSWSGTPSIRGTLLAGGMTGLIKLYDWASNICTVADENNNFPIKSSKKYADDIIKTRTSDFPTSTYGEYKNSISPNPFAGKEAESDRLRLTGLHDEVSRAADLWPRELGNFDDIDSNEQPKVLEQLKKILMLYSGCTQITLDKMPMTTRKEYNEFLINIGDLAESNYENSLYDQMINMSTKFSDKKKTIETDVRASMKGASDYWKSIKSTKLTIK